MHRVRTIRCREGVSLRTAARHMGESIPKLRRQEDENTDMSLSDLYKWKDVLQVPLMELLEEAPASLSAPVQERAHLVRIMKTALALLERAESPATLRLAQTLVDQLVEMMPELENVGPWHAIGQRRTLDDYGRAATPIPVEMASYMAVCGQD